MGKLMPTIFWKKILLLLWSIFCVVAFINYPGRISYIYQFNLSDWHDILFKLMRIDPFNALGNLATALLGIMLFSLACVSLGTFFLQRIYVAKQNELLQNFEDWLVLFGTSFLLGQGIFSLFYLILGGLHIFTPTNVIIVMLSGFLLGVRALFQLLLKNFPAQNDTLFEKSGTRNDKIILCLSLCILFLCLLHTSSRLSYDSVAIYFSDAKITALTNQIQFFPNDSYVVSSFHTGIQYAAVIQVFGDQAARMYSWVNGLIIIIFSLAIGEKLGMSARARLMLLVLLLTSTAFLDLLGDGKIDLASSAPILAAVYWMVVGDRNKPTSTFLLIGFFTGFAIISRPFNVFLMGLFIGLFYLLQAYLQKNSGRLDYKLLLKPFIWISPGIVGLGAFHLFANWMILGDPLAPLNNALIVTPSIWQWSVDPDNIWIIRLLYPFAITFMNTPQTLGNISPLFVAFLPGFFMRGVRERLNLSKDLIVLLVVALITLVLWITLFFTVIEIRYVLFLWIILFIPLAKILAETLESIGAFFRKLMELTLILTLAFVAVRAIFISLDTYSPIDKQGLPHCYDIDLCKYLESINKLASPGERVLALGAYRYYLRPDLLACSSKGEEYLILERLSNQDSSAFWREVYRQGYKFIAYEKNYTERHLKFGITPNPDNTPDWLHLEPIYGHPGDPEIAYIIQVKNPPFKSEVVCTKTDTKIWEVQSLPGVKK